MSVYNSEKYLSEAIESILEQTFTNFEFIIINDGSTDNSLLIVEYYKAKDNRIISISRENKGLPYSLNEAISLAKGKYIARMDADDISLPNRLECQLKLMESNLEIGVCGSWAESFEKGRRGKILKHPKEDLFLKAKLFFSVCFIHPTVMCNAELLKEYAYNNKYTNSQDFDLWVRLSNKTKFYNLQMVLLRYRISDSSITSIIDNSKTDKRYCFLKQIYTNSYNFFGFEPTERFLQVQYVLASNNRLKKGRLKYLDLKDFLNYTIRFNRESQAYNERALSSLLFKKSMLWFFYNIYGLKNLKDCVRFVFSKIFFNLLIAELLFKVRNQVK